MKTALVTGVSRTTGIGFAICKQLMDDGYFVYAIYNSENSCEAALQDSYQGKFRFMQCNFTNRDALNELIEEMKKIALDLIVNNAGAFPDDEDFDDYDLSTWDTVLAVNVTAPFAISVGLKQALNKNAVIINIASTDGYKGSFSSISYAASKAALINVTQSLAINYGYDEKKIRVVAIAPGWVKTDQNMIPEISWKLAPQLTPLGRFADTAEIANFVSFLSSDKASFITGNTLIIDGGYSIVDYNLLRESGRNIVE